MTIIRLAPSPRDTSAMSSPRSSSNRSQGSSTRGGFGAGGGVGGGGGGTAVSIHHTSSPNKHRPSLPISPRGGAAMQRSSRRQLQDEFTPEISKEFFKSTSNSSNGNGRQPPSPGAGRVMSPRSQGTTVAAAAAAAAVGTLPSSPIAVRSPSDPPAPKAQSTSPKARAVMSSSYSAAATTVANPETVGPYSVVANNNNNEATANHNANNNTAADPVAQGGGKASSKMQDILNTTNTTTPTTNKSQFQSSQQQQQQEALNNNNNSTTTTNTRLKRMLVVDPESGRKVHLHEDDHSLTDKELHVWHKKVSKRRAQKESVAAAQQQAAVAIIAQQQAQADMAAAKATAARASAHAHHHQRTLSDGTNGSTLGDDETGTLQTLQTDDHTLETASALTEVSYYGRYKLHSGPFQCIIPTSCHSIEQMALGDFNVDDKVKEARDDADSVSRGRYKHLLEDENGIVAGGCSPRNSSMRKSAKEKGATNNNNGGTDGGGVLSPISALANTLSPRIISNVAKSFFDSHTNNNNNNNHKSGDNFANTSAAVETKFRRICLVVFPKELKQCLEGTLNNGRGMGLLGIKFVQNGGDFQAHVNYVQRGSKAERMGVRKGDVVSFAVALSNMTEVNNSFLAEKLIKRLESVGMRTSYRELYDIFLSKTTNERPIGMVFRRWKSRHRGNNNNNSGLGSPNNIHSPTSTNIQITNEFEWSTDFLQSLSIKCREYEFEQKVPLSMDMELAEKEDVQHSPLTSFLPRPNVDTTPSNGMVADYLSGLFDNLATRYSCVASPMPIMKYIEHAVAPPGEASTSAVQGKNEKSQEDFLSNRTLCSLVEQSVGLIFLRRVAPNQTTNNNNKKGTFGSGFTVIRKAEGSWSPPCFLSIIGSKDKFTEDSKNDASSSSSVHEDVKMIVIRKKELVNNLILGNVAKFSVRKEDRANALIRDAAIICVNEGRFQLAKDFFLAVKVNDVQNQGAYSLSTDQIEASDILTGTISPPEQSVDFYGALQSLELPYSMHSHPVIPDMLQRYSDSDWVEFLPDHSIAGSSCGMRTKLQMISQRNTAVEDQREIDIFARKFKYYLMDGVPVHRVLATANNSGLTEEKVLRLTIKDPTTLFSSSLELTRKRRPGVSNVGIPSNFSTSFENVTKLSRRPPSNISNLDEEEKKRFFSVETDLSPGPVMMLAKSKKDAMILLCGLKLLLEKEKMLLY